MAKTIQTVKNKKIRIIIFILFLFFPFIVLQMTGFLSIVNGANNKNLSVAIDIHSFEEANYSQDRNHAIIPGVHLDIIRGILVDRGLSLFDIDVRLATLTAILSSPIPSATPNPLETAFPMTLSGTNSELSLSSPTITMEIQPSQITPLSTISQTTTSISTITASPTLIITTTKLPSLTTTSTVIHGTNTPINQPSITSTSQLTNTRTVAATNTVTSPTNIPTSLPTNTATTQPIISPTSQPNNTPTIAATNTPTVQPTSSPTRQSTNTSTPLFTNTPRHNTPTNQATSTLTLTPTFTPSPSPFMTPTEEDDDSLPFPFSVNNSPPPNGFINSISPSHNDINVSMDLAYISVFYNQPMELGTLGHGVQRVSNYQLRNTTDPLNPIPMKIILVNYDPDTYIANIVFEATPDDGWESQSTFEFISKSTIRNVCGTDQGVDVKINFSTGTSGMTSSKNSPY